MRKKFCKFPTIKMYSLAPHLSCAHSSCALSDRYHFPASHNRCCKCWVLVCYFVFDEENVQLPSSHPSTIQRYVCFSAASCFALHFAKMTRCINLVNKVNVSWRQLHWKSEQWGKDRDWNVPPLQMDSWSIIGKFSTWEGRDGYIIRLSSSKIEIFTVLEV